MTCLRPALSLTVRLMQHSSKQRKTHKKNHKSIKAHKSNITHLHTVTFCWQLCPDHLVCPLCEAIWLLIQPLESWALWALDTFCLLACAKVLCYQCFLLQVSHRRWRWLARNSREGPKMYNLLHVWAVNAHSKGYSGHYNMQSGLHAKQMNNLVLYYRLYAAHKHAMCLNCGKPSHHAAPFLPSVSPRLVQQWKTWADLIGSLEGSTAASCTLVLYFFLLIDISKKWKGKVSWVVAWIRSFV